MVLANRAGRSVFHSTSLSSSHSTTLLLLQSCLLSTDKHLNQKFPPVPILVPTLPTHLPFASLPPPLGNGLSAVSGPCSAGYYCDSTANAPTQHISQPGYYSLAQVILRRNFDLLLFSFFLIAVFFSLLSFLFIPIYTVIFKWSLENNKKNRACIFSKPFALLGQQYGVVLTRHVQQ
jgi:hypothetical protein